jgi:hypothetical protein
VRAAITINAAGAWAGQIAALAGIESVRVIPGRGIMIAMNHRLVNTVVNRCAPPGDGDALVPVRTVTVMGTTDEHLPMFTRLFKAIHDGGSAAFVQLFHPGRELLGRRDGVLGAGGAAGRTTRRRRDVDARRQPGARCSIIASATASAASSRSRAGS